MVLDSAVLWDQITLGSSSIHFIALNLVVVGSSPMVGAKLLVESASGTDEHYNSEE